MKVYINDSAKYFYPLKYVFYLISYFSKENFEIISNKENADLIFDTNEEKSIPVSQLFYENFEKNKLNHRFIFKDSTIIKDEKNRNDYLSTIFYMVNCLQEYGKSPDDTDNFGRFKYESSWQHKFDKIEANTVLEYIFAFLDDNGIEKKPEFNSKVFVSHDIDTINGSLLQDGFWALKRGRIDILLGLIFKEVTNKKEWKNIDQIINLESEYDIKSTFFWLVKKGMGQDNIKNADYSISRQKKTLDLINKNGWQIGLHKSCNTYSIDEELLYLPEEVNKNRHHFLRFQLPELYDDIENSKIDFDSSVGFAERYGFRNGFAMPFKPYNFSTQEAYDFIEMPLMVMDGSFQKYLKLPVERTAEKAIEFFEKHRKNSYISLLWHNTHFTNYKYKGYKKEFIKIVKYLYESNFEFISSDEIIKEFLL